jgi:hypothetical protein
MDHGSEFGRRLPLIALAVAGAAIAVAVFGVPLRSVLLLGLLLLCPLLMAGMHGGGHAHGQAPRQSGEADVRRETGHRHGDGSDGPPDRRKGA